MILFQVKDTLYKFWVLKVRLREWGTDKGEGHISNSQPGSVAGNNRIFDPNNENGGETLQNANRRGTYYIKETRLKPTVSH